jgi:hypothetical protein
MKFEGVTIFWAVETFGKLITKESVILNVQKVVKNLLYKSRVIIFFFKC